MPKKSKSPKKSQGLYVLDDGTTVLTNSMLTSFRRCIKQSEYKYYHRLKPKMMGSPLKRGGWVHELLEVHGQGGDWKKHHKKLCIKFEELFDEEKDFYGDMPTEIETIMKSYFWHYKRDPWTYHESELELEAMLPNGILLRGQVDNLIENEYGLWLVDHKTHKTIPNLRYRMLDTQSPLYIWLAWQNNIPVQGFIWNYVRWKAPTVPKLAYAGTARERLSTRAIETDYPTYLRAIKEYGFNPKKKPYSIELERLKAQRYTPGELTTSPFFQRVVMEKSEALVDRVLKEAMRTTERMNSYDFSDPEAVERTVGRHCEYMCSYTDLCGMELLGAHTKPLIKQNFEVGDPLSYYHDKAGEVDGKEI
jgi:hypothetical protein